METKETTCSGLLDFRQPAEHRFFASLSAAIVLLVLVGFSRTYYLHSLFKTPSLSVFLHVHGAVMTGLDRSFRSADLARCLESHSHP